MYTISNLNVRSTPDSSSTKNIIGTLKAGEEVTLPPTSWASTYADITQNVSGWQPISYKGSPGYVFAKYLSQTKPTIPAGATKAPNAIITTPQEQAETTPPTDYATYALIGAGVLCLLGAIIYAVKNRGDGK